MHIFISTVREHLTLSFDVGSQTPAADISSLSLSAKHRLIPAIYESIRV